jgi:hypothetical protein
MTGVIVSVGALIAVVALMVLPVLGNAARHPSLLFSESRLGCTV